jgi:hypothetical protein
MFVVTTAPGREAKLRRSGINGGVRAESNTCRSYGAWQTARHVWLQTWRSYRSFSPRRHRASATEGMCVRCSRLPPHSKATLSMALG